MATNQPLDLDQKLRDALASVQKIGEEKGLQVKIHIDFDEAQKLLDEMDLHAKVKIDYLRGNEKLQGIEDSIDRTERKAEEAAKTPGGGGEPGKETFGWGEKVTEGLNRLTKALEVLTGKIDKVGIGGKGRKPETPESTPEPPLPGEQAGSGGAEEESPFVNPAILQGLLQNPTGTMKNILNAAVMGTAANKGVGGIYQKFMQTGMGKALGANVFEAGQFVAPEILGAAPLAVLGASTLGVMRLQEGPADRRIQDAQRRMEDIRFGHNLGIDVRAGGWEHFGEEEWRSRRDINYQQVMGMFQSAGVGLGKFGETEQDKFTRGQEAIDLAMRIGINKEQMGGLIGAEVRGGGLILDKAHTDQWTKYLALIEQWTNMGQKYGISNLEQLKTLTDISNRAMQGTGVVTQEAQRIGTSLTERIRANLPEELRRTAIPGQIEAAFGAEPANDAERVWMMNAMMGPNGELTEEARKNIVKIFGEKQTSLLEKEYGPKQAGMFLAEGATQNDLIREMTRMKWADQDRAEGTLPQYFAFKHGMEPRVAGLMFAASRQAEAEGKVSLSDKIDIYHDLEKGPGKGQGTGWIGENEAKLAKWAEQVHNTSALTAESAREIKEFNVAIEDLTNTFIINLDKIRMGGLNYNNTDPRSMVGAALRGINSGINWGLF